VRGPKCLPTKHRCVRIRGRIGLLDERDKKKITWCDTTEEVGEDKFEGLNELEDGVWGGVLYEYDEATNSAEGLPSALAFAGVTGDVNVGVKFEGMTLEIAWVWLTCDRDYWIGDEGSEKCQESIISFMCS
jgi:hypothetical protein